jgi:small subunit ribosomal protein S4
MKRKHKTYSKPKRPFDKTRIDEEEKIIKDYGLKNKREIWKAEARVKNFREKAKRLIAASPEQQHQLFESLKKMGFKVNSIGDVLSLDKQAYLKRRLQTVLVTKRIASTLKGARQLITHKKVFVGDSIMNSPSYIVPIELENQIKLKIKAKKEKAHEVTENA